MSLLTYFSGNTPERISSLCSDSTALRAAAEAENTRFIALWRSQCMVEKGRAVLLKRAQLGPAGAFERLVYLGLHKNQHLFAVELLDDLTETDLKANHFENARSLLGGLNNDDAGLLACAKGVLEWRTRHKHCGVCGARNLAHEGGYVLTCSNTNCGTKSFPRVDPAIIVLVTRGEQCLLGHQNGWPEQRYSTIAGFAEPGESLEDTVRREVREETNIRVGRTHYKGSQPWPFPTALMIGFHAEALSSKIRLNDAELADAQWFSRATLMEGAIVLPPRASIAFQLIEAWFDKHDGPPLAQFNLSGTFSRSAGSHD